MTKYGKIYDSFKKYDRKYFFTIKPPANALGKIYEVISYLDSRTNCYMLVHCKSRNGYEHFHGIMSLKANVKPESIRRKVNRAMGFLQIDPMNDFIRSYQYITDTERNIPVARYLKLDDDSFTQCHHALCEAKPGAGGAPH